jgi:anti-sigma-K factor RskA
LDVKEYISSGILELYASGSLSEDENKDVEEAIKNNPQIKTELELIIKTLCLYAKPNLKTPHDSVKSNILKKIKQTESLSKDNNTVSKTTDRKQVSSYKYLMAASIAFLFLSLFANYFLWTKLKDANNEIAVLSDQKKVMVQEFETVSRKLVKASADMEIMKDRNYKMVDMKGMEKSPSSNVLAFWNPETKKVYIEVLSLPVPPPDKQYQLWALSNGKPIDAGVMDVDPSDKSLHEMKSMEDARAFAITLEPKGGSKNPTLDEMYVMGNI